MLGAGNMLPTRRKSSNTLQTPTTTTMPSKLENPGESRDFSPVLFMTVEGEPMRFFLCPGPAKVVLLPLIEAGGGMLCKAQEPGAVMLVDPHEAGSLTESTAHWYVSAQYIRDCIEKNEQLELEDYRMKPRATDTQSTKRSSSRSTSSGRTSYTPEEDAAIIAYVATRKDRLKGNRLWQEMKAKHLTGHSWQSMKYRYLRNLKNRPMEAPKEGSSDRDAKVAENQETRVEDPSTEKPTASSSDDVTSSDAPPQADDLPMEAGSSESTGVPPTAGLPPDLEEEQQEEQKEKQQEEEQKEEQEDEQVEEQQQQEEEVVEEQQEEEEEAVPTEAPQHTSYPVKSSGTPKMAAPPSGLLQSPFQLCLMPDTPPSQPTSPEKAGATSPCSSPSPKKARATSPCSSPKASTSAAGPSPQPSPRQPTESSPSAGGAASPPAQQGVEKSGEKRKLGILEMATKEFEDDSVFDLEETPDLLEAADPQPIPDTPPKHPARGASPARATETETETETGTTTAVQTGAAPRPHLFIFDGESQEEGSQPMDCEGAAVPAGQAAEVASPARTQLSEDMQRLRDLMKQTGQDLDSVTKALLRTSGVFSAAVALLQDPDSARGPFWTRSDDRLLLASDDRAARRALLERYGKEGVARRLAFLAE